MKTPPEVEGSEFHDPANLSTFFAATLAKTDPELSRSIEAELHRRRHQIELIASETRLSGNPGCRRGGADQQER